MPLAPSASLGAASYAAPAAEQWAPPPEGRPIIRPPVTASTTSVSTAGNSRRTPMIPAALAAEDLGIEESEFDKPAYLRRGLHAHDPSNAR
jgi:hypothetical protein